jgi:hypothetical protein
MSKRDWRDDEDDWTETGSEYDSADDEDGDSDDADMLPCPDCGAEIYADLDHCPRCGHWLTDADRESRGTGLFSSRSVRWIAGVLLAIFVFSLLAELLLFG